MNEVNRKPVHFRPEMSEGVHLLLLRTPIELSAPGRDEILKQFLRNSVSPIVVFEVVRPACLLEPAMELIEFRLRDLYAEFFELHGFSILEEWDGNAPRKRNGTDATRYSQRSMRTTNGNRGQVDLKDTCELTTS